MKTVALLSVAVSIAVSSWGSVQATAKTPGGVDLAALKGWNIVVADDAIPGEKYAAEEFQEFFRQASGLTLPIVHQVNRPDRHIFIGPSLAMRSSNVSFGFEDFGDEDLRIVVRDRNIAIAGGRPRGTLYGVYTFLEDYLGVRFLTIDHTHVPPVGDLRVVEPVDRFYHPPIEYRQANYGENVAYPKQAARLRNNAVVKDPKFGGSAPFTNINHSWYQQVMVEKYGVDHPEYYALLGADYTGRKGVAGERSTHWESQLCLANPDVFKIVLESVRDELKQRPGARNVSVSQNDGYGYCTCDKCAAIDEREESQMGALLTFVNKVADEVAKTHPEVMVGTLAYNWLLNPPKNLKPRPNVQIQLCSVPCSPLYPIGDQSCTQNERFRRVLSDWGRICENISIWNYNLNHWNFQLPNPNMRVVESNIRYFVANSVQATFMQSPDGLATELSDLKNYVTSRLLWDPNQSGKKLRDEFLDLHYCSAAGPIRDYIDFLHIKARIDTKSKPWVSFCGWRDNFGLDDQFSQTGIKLFEEALHMADNEDVRSRVEKASICVYSAAIEPAYMWSHTATHDGKGEYHTRPIDPSLASARPYAKIFFQLCDKYGVNRWAEGQDIDVARGYIRRAYGLKENQPF